MPRQKLYTHTHTRYQKQNKKRSVGNVNNQLSILEYQMATWMTGSQSVHLLLWCKETRTTQSPFTARKQKTSFTCRAAAGPVSLCQKELINFMSKWSQKENTATSNHWQMLIIVQFTPMHIVSMDSFAWKDPAVIKCSVSRLQKGVMERMKELHFPCF